MAIKKPKNKISHYTAAEIINPQEPEEIPNCVKYVVDAFESWSDHWANKMTEFEKYYDRWYGVPPKRDEDWQSQFHKRLTWQGEKTLVARIHAALFPNSAPIDVTRTEVTDDRQALLSKSIVSHWFKVGEVSREFLSSMRSAAIYGTGLFEDDWYVRKEMVSEKETVQIPDYRPMVDEYKKPVLDEDGNVKTYQVGEKPFTRDKNKLKVVEDRYRVKKANIFAWKIHPNKLTDEDDFPAIKQEFITYNDLLERQQELAKYGITAFDEMDKIKDDKFKIEEAAAKRFNKDGKYTDEKNPLLEVLNYWGLYAEAEGEDGYKKGAKKRPAWIMVVNRKYKIKLMDNPYWHKKPPLFHIVWTEDEKPSYYGIGLAQIGADAEDRANNSVNIRTDVKRKSVRGSGWYNANDKKIRKVQLTTNVPGLMRPCSDVNNAVKYDVIPGPDITDYKEEEIAVNDHREITGASSALLPAENPKNRPDTLGGMQQDLGQALSKLKPDIQMMELMGVRKIANRAFLLTRQFFTKEEAIELLAPEDQLKQMGLEKIYKLSPGEIIGNVHFFSTGLSEVSDKAQNIDKLLKFTEVTGKIPAMAQMMNYQEIGKQIGIWLGMEDIDRFINQMPTPPVPQPQAQPPMPQPMPMPPQMPMPAPMMPPGGNGGAPPMPQGMPPALAMMLLQRMGGGLPPQGVPVLPR